MKRITRRGALFTFFSPPLAACNRKLSRTLCFTFFLVPRQGRGGWDRFFFFNSFFYSKIWFTKVLLTKKINEKSTVCGQTHTRLRASLEAPKPYGGGVSRDAGKMSKTTKQTFVGSNTVAAYQRKDTNAPIRLTE